MRKTLKMEKLEYVPVPLRKTSKQKTKYAKRANKNREAGYILLYLWTIIIPLLITFNHFNNPLAWLTLLCYSALLGATYLAQTNSEKEIFQKLFHLSNWVVIIIGPGIIILLSL